MAIQNRIQILRSTNNASVPTLNAGEFAYTANGDVLFIGHPDGSSGNIRVGGEQIPGVLTANQAIVANSTSFVNDFKTLDITVNGEFTANGGVGTSGQVLYSGGSGANAYWGASASGSLAGLTDTDTAGAADASILIYDTGTTTWHDRVVSGDATMSDQGALTLASTTVTGGSYGDANTVATFTVDAKGRLTAAADADINHDTLLNFVANEHIDHSSVSISNGNGITGGGDLTATRTLSVVAANGISVTAAGVNVSVGTGETSLIANTTGLWIDDTTLSIASSQVTGLATSATTDTTNASNITSGTLPSAQLPDLAVSDFGGAAIVTEAEGLNSSDNDTSIPTTAAVKDYIDTNVTAQDLDITDGTVTSAVDLDSQTMTIQGTTNEVEVGLSGQTFTIGLPNSVTISQNLVVSGNLTVQGTTTTVDTTQLLVEDNLIGLAVNNAADVSDIGFYGQYNDGSTKYTGLIRDASDADNAWKLVENLTNEPGVANTDLYDAAGEALAKLYVGDLNASAVTAASLTLTTDLAVADGGTGASSFTDNGIIYGNGTSALSVTAAGTQYQVLQAGSGGVPEWGSLDGGTF